MLGFESESRLFKSQRLQAALAYCHKNVESWYREVRLAPNLEQQPSGSLSKTQHQHSSSEDSKSPLSADEDVTGVIGDGNKQLITKEVIDKFHKPKKWYKHFKLLSSAQEPPVSNKQPENMDGTEKVKSIDRYKDMSKLIEEKFGKKTHNPVKKSASFMFSTKRIDFEDARNQRQTKTNSALAKCQSLDTQLHSMNADTSKQSDSFDFQFQRRVSDIRNNDLLIAKSRNAYIKREPQSLREIKPVSLHITEIDLDEIKTADEAKLKIKSKPDLIPTLTKDNSFITDRLCAEFHVKSKVQKRGLLRSNDKLRNSCREESVGSFSLVASSPAEPETGKIVVQVHEISKAKQQLDVDDIPYSQVADEIAQKAGPIKAADENIYAEICENSCSCVSKRCDCKRTTRKPEYCYVKLGSNGESITSDSDEAIYNTLR